MKRGDMVFVYGTLRSGERMDLGKGFYAGMCKKVRDDFILASIYNLGSFPGVKLGGAPERDEAPGVVAGEVFEITDQSLTRLLDSYEGFPDLYGRSVVETLGGLPVWVYTYNGRVNEDMLIQSGDWLLRREPSGAKSRNLQRAA